MKKQYGKSIELGNRFSRDLKILIGFMNPKCNQAFAGKTPPVKKKKALGFYKELNALSVF